MNSFQVIGQAQLAAGEGQRLIALAFGRWVSRVASRVLGVFTSRRSNGTVYPL